MEKKTTKIFPKLAAKRQRQGASEHSTGVYTQVHEGASTEATQHLTLAVEFGENLINFSKMHGLGNDFMVINTITQAFEPDPQLIRQWADRHTGVGFDQLLLITPPPTPDLDFGYRIFNADGTEVQQCGNGARCLAYYVKQHGMTTKSVIQIASPTTRMQLRYHDHPLIEVDMGKPNFEPVALPFIYPQKQLGYELEIEQVLCYFGAVSMGNPHIVLVVPDVDTADVNRLGKQLSHHPAFPEQVNVGFMQRLSPNKIKLRVYERGVGETQACGSGACAAVVIGRMWELLDTTVDVTLLGGHLQIAWPSPTESIYMTGEAAHIFEGKI